MIIYLLGKQFLEHSIELKIKSLDFINPKPNVNDELIRYKISVGINSDSFQANWIVDKIKKNNYDKGLTIKRANGEVIYFDEYTADIKLRRMKK